MHAMAGPRRDSRIARLTLLALAATLNLFLHAPAAFAYGGQWSASQTWTGTAVHMSLLRGDGVPYHSRIVWWQAEAVDSIIGGQWG